MGSWVGSWNRIRTRGGNGEIWLRLTALYEHWFPGFDHHTLVKWRVSIRESLHSWVKYVNFLFWCYNFSLSLKLLQNELFFNCLIIIPKFLPICLFATPTPFPYLLSFIWSILRGYILLFSFLPFLLFFLPFPSRSSEFGSKKESFRDFVFLYFIF